MKHSSTLIFTVAINGFHWRYAELINSHRDYAYRHGYHYVCVNRPRLTSLGQEIAWLKLSLALEALKAGYDRVMYVDADARIRECTPALDHLLVPERTVYAAKGYSGRINSGVLIFVRDEASIGLLQTILNNIDAPLPREDEVGWGENGHIIHFFKNHPSVAVLPAEWNNNHTPEMDDYIRHYSAGPLREEFRPSRMGHTLSWFTVKAANVWRRLDHCPDDRNAVIQKLPVITQQALRSFPTLTTP